MRKNPGLIIGLVVAALAAGAGLFYAGILYAELQASNAPQPLTGSGASREAVGLVGVITGRTGDTLQIRADQDVISVTLSAATSLLKMAPAAPADLQVGDQVSVRGDRDASGSVSAAAIHILPAGPGGDNSDADDQSAVLIEIVPARATPDPVSDH